MDDGFSDCSKPSLRSGNHENAKLRLSEQSREVTRQGELQILPSLLLPDAHRLVAEVNFNEHRPDDPCVVQNEIPVRDRLGIRRHRLVETPPAREFCIFRQRPEFHRHVNLVYLHLVIDEKIADKRFAVASADSPIFSSSEKATARGERVNSFAAGGNTADEKSVQQTAAR